jgi:acyl-CoA dehydrogenase
MAVATLKDRDHNVDVDIAEQLRATIRRFVRERLVPLERQVDDENAVPAAVIAEMRALGIPGLTIPAEYGGLGLNAFDEAQVVMELGWTSPAFRSVFGTNMGIGAHGIIIDGTDAQRQHYLPKLASGELIGSFCLTEPEAGSDAGSLRTTARRDGESYVINGTKRYITNAPSAGLFTVMARSRPDVKGADGISAFLVDASLPGIAIGTPNKKMGQRGAMVADVIFDNVRVPASAIVGGPDKEGQGFRTAMKVLDRGRIHISALCVGAARRLIFESLSYAGDRKQFGQPIGAFQLVQAMLADSQAECYAAETMVLDTARRHTRGEQITLEASCCKMYCSEMVGRVADRAVQIHGGAGYMSEYGIERFYRDVRLFRIYEGTTQIQQLVIAREMRRRAEARGEL